MRIHPLAFAVVALGLSVSLRAQQTWVPLTNFGSTGLVVADSPLPPRLLEPFPAAFAGTVFEFRGAGFHRRSEPLPVEFGFARAAAYDPIGQRIVVYCADVPLISGPGSSAICVFDGARWSVLPTVGTPPLHRLGAVFTFDPQRGSLLLFGGRSNQTAGASLGDTWELSGATWTQRSAAGPSPRFDSAIARSGAGGPLLLFGGVGSSMLADTWQWDGVTWTELAPGTVPPARCLHTMANDPSSGRAVMFGGRSSILGGGLATIRTDLWSWTGSDWQAQPAPPVSLLVSPRLVTSSGELLLIGREPKMVVGQVVDDASTVVHVQRRSSGGAWSSLFVGGTLPATTLPAAAFDPVRGEIVQFGGRDSTTNAYVNRTAVWNDGWTIHSPVSAPSPRSFCGMAFDALRGETVLFGGTNGTSYLGDTWVWNGVTWQQRMPAAAPPARAFTAMAWDPSRGEVVLVGGQDAAVTYTDTWAWNGTTWSLVPTAAPPTPAKGQLAFDVGRQTLSLYIDRVSIAPSELWDLQASGWVLVSTAAGLGRLAYDPAVGSLALLTPYGRADYVAGVWLSSSQRANGIYVVADPGRNALLAGGPEVLQSTATPAAVSTYGTGCGPLGEVTCSFDRAASFGVVVTADVRTCDSNTPTFLFCGATERNLPIGGGCTSYVDGLITGLGAIAGSHGWATFPLAIPATPGLTGFELFAQPVTLHVGGLGIGNGARLRIGI